MHALTDQQIRTSFVNASRRESTQAPLPPLSEIVWDDLDLLGWTDPKAPQRGYAVIDTERGPVGLLLRTQANGFVKKDQCDWCQDPQATDGVVLYVAKRAGAAGRDGNTVGAMIHRDLRCSVHVRRKPTPEEGGHDPEAFVAGRVAGLRQRAARFAQRVVDGD